MKLKLFDSWIQGNDDLPTTTEISVVYKSLNNNKFITQHNCLVSNKNKTFIDSNNVMTISTDRILMWCPTWKILEFNNHPQTLDII